MTDTSEFTLTDTGKYFLGASVESGEVRAKGDNGVAGTALTIKLSEIGMEDRTIGNEEPSISLKRGAVSDADYDKREFRSGDIDATAIENARWVVKGHFMTTSESDMKTLGRLRMMTRTKGYKELGSGSATGESSSDPNRFFANPVINYSKYDHFDSAGTVLTTINSVNVRITNLVITHNHGGKGTKKVIFEMTLVELGERGTY